MAKKSQENSIALYRKYRPHVFKDVLGQEQVTKVLGAALKEGNVSHAYLFAGSRGTGKTSVARILARELGTTESDLYEIDAASNRGIDDVRELRESVRTMPFESRYKVYIIDEVHMLTKEAFNALLKTLEEPPSHVVFVLATTEMDRLPDTVISRCEVHQFKKPSREVIKSMIVRTASDEGFTLEPTSADLIALLSEGSFRDALGVLQKVIRSSSDTKVSVEEVALITGAPRTELVNGFLRALHEKDGTKGLKAIYDAVTGNVDMQVFAKLILEKLRAVLLIRFGEREGGWVKEMVEEEYSKEDAVFLRELASDRASCITADVLKEMLRAYRDIDRAYIPHLPLELVVMKLTSDQQSSAEGTLFE